MRKRYLWAIFFIVVAGLGSLAYSNQLRSWAFSAPVVQLEDYLPAAVKGDIFFENSSGTFKGFDGAAWVELSSVGGGGANLNVNTKTSSYTLTSADDVILGDANSAAFTLSLPAAASNEGKIFHIKKVDSTFNAITIDPNSSETVDGSTTTTVNTQNENLQIISDGSNWKVLTRDIPSNWIDGGTNTITATTSNPSKGTIVVDKFWYRRVGSNLEARIEYRQSSSGSAGSGDYLFQAVPSGLQIDTATLNVYATVEGSGGFVNNNTVGSIQVRDTFTTAAGAVSVYDSTNVRLMVISDYNVGVVSAGYIDLSNSGVQYLATYSVPISGWK